MRILHLTLKQPWFNLILEGKKTVEYRERKPYWASRLLDRDGVPRRFDAIKFRNGYSPTSPTMLVRYRGLVTTDHEFQLQLGEILEA